MLSIFKKKTAEPAVADENIARLGELEEARRIARKSGRWAFAIASASWLFSGLLTAAGILLFGVAHSKGWPLSEFFNGLVLISFFAVFFLIHGWVSFRLWRSASKLRKDTASLVTYLQFHRRHLLVGFVMILIVTVFVLLSQVATHL